MECRHRIAREEWCAICRSKNKGSAKKRTVTKSHGAPLTPVQVYGDDAPEGGSHASGIHIERTSLIGNDGRVVGILVGSRKVG